MKWGVKCMEELVRTWLQQQYGVPTAAAFAERMVKEWAKPKTVNFRRAINGPTEKENRKRERENQSPPEARGRGGQNPFRGRARGRVVYHQV